MSVSFIRIDDRMIHGQTCTRWAREYPCDGLIAVNDKAAKSDVLKAAYKAASGKKTFVWTVEDFKKKAQKVLDSDTRYFLITKDPIDMRKILVEQGFKCGITAAGKVSYGKEVVQQFTPVFWNTSWFKMRPPRPGYREQCQ